MSEHPEFPKDYEELPSLKYLVDQASKIEDVSNCSIGYYAAQKKTAEKIDKLNNIIATLNQTALELKKVVNSDEIGLVIGKKTNALVRNLNGFNERILRIQNDLDIQMNVTIQRLDDHIQKVNQRFMPPLWRNGWFWFWILVVASIAYAYGKGMPLRLP